MAIALEADFRSIKTGQAPESAERQPAGRGGGEEFASSLERARSAGAEKEAPEVEAEAAPAGPSLPFLAAEPELAPVPDLAAADTPQTDSPVTEVAEALLKSELAIDREIVREEVKAPPADAAPPKNAEAAPQLAASPPQAKAPEPSGQQSSIPAETAPAVPASPVPSQTIRPEHKPAVETNRALAASAPEVAVMGEAATTAAAAAVEVVQVVTVADAEAPEARDKIAAPAPANPDAFALTQPSAQPGPGPDAGGPDAVVASLTGTADKVALTDTASQSSPAASSPALAASAAAPAPPAVSALAAAPAQAVLTASLAQIVDIVAQSAEDGQSDRVVVQLDPPELGRVSIDFKFDAQGLQHVTITSETPEAMRQLRQMHFELVQSLERHGIGGQNMTFQHQQQGAPQSQTPNPFTRAGGRDDAGIGASAALASTQQLPGARTLPGGRLDIRL